MLKVDAWNGRLGSAIGLAAVLWMAAPGGLPTFALSPEESIESDDPTIGAGQQAAWRAVARWDEVLPAPSQTAASFPATALELTATA